METQIDSKIEIRSARPSDCSDVALLLKNSDLPIDDINPELPGFLVATNGSEIVGAVGIENLGPFALLRSLAVSLEARGTGVGNRLFEAALSSAKQNSAQTVYLLTMTAADYFGRRGFTRIERDAAPEEIQKHEQFTSLCPDSAVVMRRNL